MPGGSHRHRPHRTEDPTCRNSRRNSSRFGGRWAWSFRPRGHFPRMTRTLVSSNKNAYRSGSQDRRLGIPWPAKTDEGRVYFGNFRVPTKDHLALFALVKRIFSTFRPGRRGGLQHRSPEDQSRGPTLKLASPGRSEPLPDGTVPKEPWRRENRFLWSWHDEKGEGRPQENQLTIGRHSGESERVGVAVGRHHRRRKGMALAGLVFASASEPGRGVRDLCDSSPRGG